MSRKLKKTITHIYRMNMIMLGTKNISFHILNNILHNDIAYFLRDLAKLYYSYGINTDDEI